VNLPTASDKLQVVGAATLSADYNGNLTLDGKLGVGMTAVNKLDVSGNAAVTGSLTVGGTNNLNISNASNSVFAYASSDLYIGSNLAKTLQIATNNTSRLIVDSAGNVGIGTTVPAYTLDVTGQIRATQGYVFGDGTKISSTPTFNVKDYGAKGDGSTNDSSAIQAAINAAYLAGGGVVFIPPTGYYYYLATGLQLLQGVTLAGSGGRNFSGYDVPISTWALKGSWLVSGDTTNSAVRIAGHGCAITGVNFGFVQPTPANDPPGPGVTWTPTTYPYAISVSAGGSFINIYDVFIMAATHGIDLTYTTGSGGGTGVNISKVEISAFRVGIRTNFVNDTITMSDIHVRNMFYPTHSLVVNYNLANLTGWDCRYTDNPMVTGFEVFQARYGILLTDDTCLGNTHSLFNGTLNNIQFNLNGSAITTVSNTTTTANFANVVAQSAGGGDIYLFNLTSNNVIYAFTNLSIPWAYGGGFQLNSGSLFINGLICQSYNNNQVFIALNSNSGQCSINNYSVTKGNGGSFAAGAGLYNLNTDKYGIWNPMGFFETMLFTGTGSPVILTTGSNMYPLTRRVKQMRVSGTIYVVQGVTSGTTQLYFPTFTEVSTGSVVTNVSTTGTNVNFDSNWLDLTSVTNQSLNALYFLSTTGVQFYVNNLSVEWR
jgi:hypothetical protein